MPIMDLFTSGEVDVQEKTELAEQWFDSLKGALSENDGKDFDINGKYDTYRLHTISTESNEQGESWLVSNKDAFGRDYGTVKGESFLTSAKSLNEFTAEQKEYLFEQALSGTLSLHARDGNAFKEKGIYVKINGMAGVTELAKIFGSDKEIKAKVENMKNLLVPRDFYGEVFPDAFDAEALFTTYRNENKTLQKLMKDCKNDPTKYTYVERAAFQLYASKDVIENPEYYETKDLCNRRADLMARSVKDEICLRFHVSPKYLNEAAYPQYDLAEDAVGSVYTKHPIGESLVVAKSLKGLLNYINEEDQEGVKYTMKDLVHSFIHNDVYGTFQYDEDNPWETSEKIAMDIRKGSNIYCKIMNPETGTYDYVKLIPTMGSSKMRKVTFLSEEEKTPIKGWLENCGSHLDTASTDEDDYKALQKKTADLKLYFENTERLIDNRTLKDKMLELFKVSSIYVIKRIDKPSNAKRVSRFVSAEALRLGAHKIATGTNIGTINKETYETMIKKDVLACKAFRYLMGDEFDEVKAPDIFWKKVSEFKRSDEFQMLQSKKIGGKAMDSMEVIGEKLQKAQLELLTYDDNIFKLND